MEISILSGCDIEWQPYSDPSSSTAPASEAVIASANSGDDNSSSDAEATGPVSGPVSNAPSPVFGVNGVEPAAAPPTKSAALAPQGFPLLRANPDANEDEPIFLLVDGTNFFRWEPTTWDRLDFNAMNIPPDGEHLGANRCFFAIATIMFHTPALQAKFPEFRERFVKKWQDSFGYPIDDRHLEEPQQVGTLAFTPEEVKWLIETRRFLKNRNAAEGKRRSSRPGRSPPAAQQTPAARASSPPPAALDSESDESCSVSNWHCSVCNNSFGTYTRCAQHAGNPRCHCFQVSQCRAAPQLVRTVFRSAGRNVGGRQQVSTAAKVLVQPEDAADAPNLDCEPPNDLEQADSSGQLQCHNSKFACQY